MGSLPHQSLTGVLLGGRFRLGRELGRGGMGAVYEAVQENIGRRVAIKVVLQDLAEDSEVLARFRREAEAAASLGHPNIVQVTDFQHRPGEPAYLVMEYLAGESLRGRLQREGTLDAGALVSISMQVLAALTAAHRAGIIHRDLKPDNVFLVEMAGLGSLAKLLDFGIAKLTESKGYTRLTQTGMMIGTPAYMSPEQMSGGTVDARSDLYSLAVMMYRSLVGRPPFTGKSPAEILKAVMSGAAVPLGTLRPDVEPRLVQVIATAMSPNPDARFTDAEAMRSALAPFVVSLSVPPQTPSGAGIASAQGATRREPAAAKPGADAGARMSVPGPVAAMNESSISASIVSNTSVGQTAPGRVAIGPMPPAQFAAGPNGPMPPAQPGGATIGPSANASQPMAGPPFQPISIPSMEGAGAPMHAMSAPPGTSGFNGASMGPLHAASGPQFVAPMSFVPGVPQSNSTPSPERRMARSAAFAIGGGVVAIVVAGVAGVAWLMSGDDPSAARTSVAGVASSGSAPAPPDDPSVSPGMPSIGSLMPAAAVGSLRMNVVGVYAAHYTSIAAMEPSIRAAAAQALSCMATSGYVANGTAPMVWGISVDANGQSIGASAADPGHDQRVTNCLMAAGQAAQFPPPMSGTPSSFGVRVQIVANE